MEQAFESLNANEYHLSIRFSPDGFDLWVCNELNVQLSSKRVSVSLFSFSAGEIVKLLTPELLLNYRTVRLICESDQYTFVPAPVFKPESAADFLHFQFNPAKNNQILFNPIPQWDSVNIFSIPKTVHDALSQLFPDTRIEHHLGYFLTENVKLQNDSGVYISVRSAMMDVVVIVNGVILLINSFSFNTPEDFTYHTLNLFDKLHLDIENCNVVLYNADKKPELQKTLELYLEVTKGD